MKLQISSKRAVGFAFLILPFCGGCLQSVGPVEPLADASQPQAEAVAETQAADELNSIAEIQNPANEDVSHGAVTVVSNDISLPAELDPGPGMIEVIKLANAGAGENVLLSYITNCTEHFALGPEEIIYLNDIGIPGRVITAMLQRDHLLQASISDGAAVEAMVEMEARPLEAGELAPAGGDLTDSVPAVAAPVEYPNQTVVAPGMDALPSNSGPEFYDALAPYGSWVDVDDYGRCWPASGVGAD